MLGMETSPWYSPDELVNMFKQASLKPDFGFFFPPRKKQSTNEYLALVPNSDFYQLVFCDSINLTLWEVSSMLT